jgi:glucan phosphoethanolaminetransferase (alkaline phosphatase superfamily)
MFCSLTFGLLYSHYYKPFPRQYRKVITQLQIIQFCMSMVIHSAIYFYYDCDPLARSHFTEYCTPYILVISYLVLFLNFYIMQYMVKGKQKSA